MESGKWKKKFCFLVGRGRDTKRNKRIDDDEKTNEDVRKSRLRLDLENGKTSRLITRLNSY